jgi:hypothetical protein
VCAESRSASSGRARGMARCGRHINSRVRHDANVKKGPGSPVRAIHGDHDHDQRQGCKTAGESPSGRGEPGTARMISLCAIQHWAQERSHQAPPSGIHWHAGRNQAWGLKKMEWVEGWPYRANDAIVKESLPSQPHLNNRRAKTSASGGCIHGQASVASLGHDWSVEARTIPARSSPERRDRPTH